MNKKIIGYDSHGKPYVAKTPIAGTQGAYVLHYADGGTGYGGEGKPEEQFQALSRAPQKAIPEGSSKYQEEVQSPDDLEGVVEDPMKDRYHDLMRIMQEHDETALGEKYKNQEPVQGELPRKKGQ